MSRLTQLLRSNNFLDHTPQARPERCESVPFGILPTYTDRPDVSKELDEKLARQCGSASPRAIAVIGLGGTGKTQLVLHYIEKHRVEYDTILWIDARDKEAARASFERCCLTLGLPVEVLSDDKPLQNSPCVQKVLALLQARPEDKKWLVVIDDVDTCSWNVSSIIPRGKAGTVVVTSQDGRASRLLGGTMLTVKVDAMHSEEAVRLLANHLGEPVTRGDCYWDLVEKITECLDRLALPVDLAGARISVQAEDWGDIASALKQYLDDYHQNQERLLHDTEYANETPYGKTVWTAWETSLSSLRAKEESQLGIYPVQLLAFLTQFDRANVHEELFRLASLGLDEARDQLDTTVPTWLRKLLDKDDRNDWNSFLYRETIATLLRYGLVRPIIGPWKGVTMHGVVQTRARQELPPGSSQWHMVFLYTICLKVHEADHVRFRRHLMAHLPPIDTLLTSLSPFQSEMQMTRLWRSIGTLCEHEGRLKEATQLQVKAADVMRSTYGDKDPETLDAMSNVALTFLKRELLHESKERNSEVIRLREAALGASHPDTLQSRHQSALILRSLGHWEESLAQELAVLEARRAALGIDHYDTLHSMMTVADAYHNLGKSGKAEELQVEGLEIRERLFGHAHHPDTIQNTSNLAVTYSRQGNYLKAEELHNEAREAAEDLLGDDHAETLRNMRNLGMSYMWQGKLMEAEELQIKILKRSEKVYGSNHPGTLKHMGDLAMTLSKQEGKLVEAEKMQIQVMEETTRVLGEEHPQTLEAVDDLAHTLLHQERWKEAANLATKSMTAYLNLLGERHPNTLRAMANIAYAKRGLGQSTIAVDLMRRVEIVSSEALGDDHAETEYYRETAALWSGINSKDIESLGADVNHSAQSR
jgi:tetratricopeptide (TPR) repeat protein